MMCVSLMSMPGSGPCPLSVARRLRLSLAILPRLLVQRCEHACCACRGAALAVLAALAVRAALPA